MGGGKYSPSFMEAVGVQILCILLIPLLPIIWIVLIVVGIFAVLLSPSKRSENVESICGAIGVVTAIPFIMTFMHIQALFAGVTKAVMRAWHKNPDFESLPEHEQRRILRQNTRRNQLLSEGLARRRYAPRTGPLSGHSSTSSVTASTTSFSHTDDIKLFEYHDLNGLDEFRLLIISPGSFDDPLHGEVTTTKFIGDEKPQYEALSYTWADESGDGESSSQFLCDEDHSIIRITKNCEAAIRRLRLPDKTRWVWIDAICINQTSPTERTYQVSMMSKIYMNARRVVVYLGEGTPHTDLLFDWLNGLKTEDLDILLKWDLDNLAVDTMISFEKYLTVGKERLLSLFSNSPDNRIEISQPELIEFAKEFFERRWFKRVWVLQEVSLPDVRNTTVLCGTRDTSAIRALHALSLIYKDNSTAMIRIFVLLRKKSRVKTSHLLDILIETRDREAGDPRDKIFGVLSIANYLDKGAFPELQADYGYSTAGVYEYYSAFFIRQHGPGFFLSLIKSPSKLIGSPSWVADWSVPWPNYRAVEGRDFAAGSRPGNEKDTGAKFGIEHGCHILTLRRQRILEGYFTRDGHIDGQEEDQIESMKSLEEDEVLIELYPGLAALMREDGGYHTFVRVCPHALSESAVKDLVDRWSEVVVDGVGWNTTGDDAYLSPAEDFKIR